jgi:hypothetical protein
MAAAPTRLFFRYGGTVRGVGWLSVLETIRDTTYYPNEVFTFFKHINGVDVTAFRSPTVTFAQFIDAVFDNFIPAADTLVAFGTRPLVLALGGKVSVADVFIGAQSCGRAERGYLDPFTLFMLRGESEIELSGIYLIGNVRMASSADLPLATAKGVLYSATLLFGIQHSQHLVGSYDSFYGEPGNHEIRFLARYRTDRLPTGLWKADYDTNCLHVLDDNGNYALMANRAAAGATRGATLEAIVGDFHPGSRVVLSGFNHILEEGCQPGEFSGVAGVFGNAVGVTKGPWGVLPIDSDTELVRPASQDNIFWRSALTGARVTSDVVLVPVLGGAQESYTLSSSNAHNIRAQAFFRGINVNNGNTVGGVLFSNRFFA